MCVLRRVRDQDHVEASVATQNKGEISRDMGKGCGIGSSSAYFDEELTTELADPRVIVDDCQGQQAAVVLDFDHAVEDEMREHHDGGLAHVVGGVLQ
jgi:hypothetical protein